MVDDECGMMPPAHSCAHTHPPRGEVTDSDQVRQVRAASSLVLGRYKRALKRRGPKVDGYLAMIEYSR